MYIVYKPLKNTFVYSSKSQDISIGNSQGYTVFEEYVRLHSIELPNSIKKIGSLSFWVFDHLETIISHITDLDQVEVDVEAFDLPITTKLYVPKGTLEAYRNTEPWRSSFTEIREIEE